MKKSSLLLLLAINPAIAENDDTFTYQNNPINPACVGMFNSSMADNPYIKSINLNECQYSNAAFQITLKSNDGSYYFYVNNKDGHDGRYSYKVWGKSTNGVYVLGTRYGGGGTLVASDLLLVSLDKSTEYIYKDSQPKVNEIIELKLLGYVIGGDRCIGDFMNVQVIGNQLNIKQYRGDNPLDCEKTKQYIIYLGKLNLKTDHNRS